ncbi:MAG: hypothetical protein KA413_03660 [Candidatus Methylopumilus sp.]|nr:hypothetical protein [Candidatus Methylopumilus sp.]
MGSNNSMDLLVELIGDKYDLTGTPEMVFNRYELPIRKIHNIEQRINGKSKSFILDGKEYKRVELLAKANYESLGYTASWSEGFAIDLLEAAITAEVVSKVSKYFKISDEYMDEKSANYPKMLEMQRSLENSSHSSYYQLQSEIQYLYQPHLRGPGNTSLNEGSSHKKERAPFIELLISEDELKVKIEESLESVLYEKNISRIESAMEIHFEYVKNSYRNGNLPQNVNEWSLEFAKVILQKIGVDSRFCNINKKRQFVCRGFDLTLIDNSNKEIIFAEVKNKDKFTVFQNISIAEFIEDRNEKIELCLVLVK